MSFFSLTEQELRSFNCVARHTVLQGPLTLVRFTDSSRGHESALGRRVTKQDTSGQPVPSDSGLFASYWMYATEIKEILGDIAAPRPYGLSLISEVSRRWALCDDWGDLGRVWVMGIPKGAELNAYFGFAKFQPRTSVEKQREDRRFATVNSYPGGSLQLVLRLHQQHWHWIDGPIRTLNVSAKKVGAL